MKRTITLIFLFVLLTSCELRLFWLGDPDTPLVGGTQVFTISEDNFVLEWSHNGINVDYFDVVYKGVEDTEWSSYDQTENAETQSLIIMRELLGPGQKVIAVRACNNEGIKSDFHTSLDSSAAPSSGWLVEFQ